MEYFVPVETTDVSTSRETLEIEETTGTRFPIGIDYGTRYFELPLVGAPRVASLPRVLSGFLGQPVSSGTVPTKVHTFDPTLAGKIAEWHSIFAVRKDPSPPIVDLFYDARGNELQLNIAPNDYLRFEATWLALHLDDAAALPTPTTDMSHRFKFSEAVVELSADGGTTWTPKISAAWGFTYNNNLDTDNAVLGTRELYDMPMGNADLEVRWSPREGINQAYRDYLMADPVTTAVRMTATSAAGEIVQVIAHAAEITEAPAGISGADVLKMIEVTARGKIGATGPAANKFLTVTITNNVATYA
jgi:hypothetical protein